MSRQTPRFSAAASRRSRAAAPRPSRRRHLYIHGGFTGTDAKFSFCFPPEEKYQGRFFQATHQLLAGEEATPRSIALVFGTTTGADRLAVPCARSGSGLGDPSDALRYVAAPPLKG